MPGVQYRPIGTALLAAIGVLLLAASPGGAQQAGSIRGTVRDAESGAAVAGATVQAVTLSGASAARAVSDPQGQFQLQVAPGRYDVLVNAESYESFRASRVPVQEGLGLSLDIALSRGTVVLNPIVISASRRQEKALDAPTHVEVVDAAAVETRTALTPLEHVRSLPGVDIASTGLIQGHPVTRGFNNVFSGSLLMMVDNRYTSVPSLRVNVPYVTPADSDIERMEVLLGPASALYGPNSANGVLHLITRSPFESVGSTVSITGGERSVFGVAARHAGAPSDRFAYKVTGEYYRGSDWQYLDPVESATRQLAQRTDPATLVGLRDFDQEVFGGEARLDFRPGDDTEAILSFGASQVGSAIELTGLGAAQIRDWRYSFAQARLQRGRLFAQAFVNTSNAGDSYLLRTGTNLVDQSSVAVAQLQHGFGLLDGRQQLTYGVDYQRTSPRTEGTILGRNEGVVIDEVGAYLQSETAVLPYLDLIAAARLDRHNYLNDVVFSPRAALVLRPGGLNNFRLTYNRAFETPTSNHLFLDLESSRLSPLPLSVRAVGVPKEGLRFRRDCAGGLCMRSPFGPDQAYLPASGALFWPAVVELLRAQGVDLSEIPAPAPSEVGSVLRVLNTTTGAFNEVEAAEVSDIDPLRPTITNTIEFGYQGLLGRSLILSADVYHTRKEDFIGPLTVETPSVFLERASLEAYLGRYLPAPQAERLAAQISGIPGSREARGIPLGTIVPEGDLTQTADLIVTYRNFGQVSHWGGDLAAELLLPGRVSVRGVYSYLSDNFFSQEALGGLSPVSLNAPRHKGAISGTYRGPADRFLAELRGRYVGGFPMNSGVYIGEVDAYTVLDATVGYELPIGRGARFTLTAQNLLDNRHREFVGAPEIGRLILTRLQYSF